MNKKLPQAQLSGKARVRENVVGKNEAVKMIYFICQLVTLCHTLKLLKLLSNEKCSTSTSSEKEEIMYILWWWNYGESF
jgi:hypothetical protein